MLQQIRTKLLKISMENRYVLLYIRKDYNLMWSVVTDIGEKCKAASRQQSLLLSSRTVALAVGATSYIEGDYRSLVNSVFTLIVYISC